MHKFIITLALSCISTNALAQGDRVLLIKPYFGGLMVELEKKDNNCYNATKTGWTLIPSSVVVNGVTYDNKHSISAAIAAFSLKKRVVAEYGHVQGGYCLINSFTVMP